MWVLYSKLVKFSLEELSGSGPLGRKPTNQKVRLVDFESFIFFERADGLEIFIEVYTMKRTTRLLSPPD